MKNFHACMHKMNKKINCLNLEIIVNANIINLISKTKFHSQLSWIQIIKKLLIQKTNLTKFQTSIRNSWFQWFFKTMMFSIEFRYAWIKWKKLYKSKKNDQIVWFMFSISKYDMFCIYMWYHFLIEIISNDVARKWTSQIWIALWNNDVKFLTNVWNSNLKKSKMFANYNVRQTNVVRKTIKIMMSELSQTWKTFLEKQRYNIQLFIVRKEFYVRQKKKVKQTHFVDQVQLYQKLQIYD